MTSTQGVIYLYTVKSGGIWMGKVDQYISLARSHFLKLP